MKTILITGGAGFIGSNFIDYFSQKHSDYHILNLDALTYAGNLDNLNEYKGFKNYTFVKGDIRNKEFIESVFKQYEVSSVIHFAAESHVDNSITNPTLFAETNVIGTLNLLNAAKKYWQLEPFRYKESYENSKFLHVSTDEVYGALSHEGYFTEDSPYAPNSPYSASKASSDMFVRSYFHTYGINVLTTNCSNNFGPKQHDEKLIPTIIRNAIKGKEIPIYGDGMNVRDWLYVLDHCKAIDLIFHSGTIGETYLIGGRNEHSNLGIVYRICDYLDKRLPKAKSYKEQITFVGDRHGHDFRYAIDSSKLNSTLKWTAEETFDTGIIKTIEWYIEKYSRESRHE